MNHFQRALQAWTLLVCAAKDRRTYTYEEIGKVMGMPPQAMGHATLAPIMHYCDQNDLPPLTVLVVKKMEGVPGGEGHEKGLVTLKGDVNRERERVFRHDWFAKEPPETEDFKKAEEEVAPAASCGS